MYQVAKDAQYLEIQSNHISIYNAIYNTMLQSVNSPVTFENLHIQANEPAC